MKIKNSKQAFGTYILKPKEVSYERTECTSKEFVEAFKAELKSNWLIKPLL